MSSTVVPAVTQSGEPVLVLKEDQTQSKGRAAMENNIAAARLICEIVRTSLGPHGMDKLILEDEHYGNRVTVTNDGAFMLKRMQIHHPAGRILADVSKATDDGVGDGTTSAVVLAGALLERADELLQKGIHPIIVVAGYRKAARKAIEVLQSIAEHIDPMDRVALENVARTSMQSKIVAKNSALLASLVVEAALGVATEQKNGSFRMDVKNIMVQKKQGGSIANTELVRGIVLDQKVARPGMPKRVENARIALVNVPFQMEETLIKPKITIREVSKMAEFLNRERETFSTMVEKLQSVGANVLICQKEIEDEALDYLARAGILAVKKALEFDGPNTMRVTGAKLVARLSDLTEEDLGHAKVVEERLVHTDKMLFITGGKNPKAMTIIARGTNKNVIDEAERSIHDAIMVVRDIIQEPSLVVGGGAVEAEIAHLMTDWVSQLEGKEQLAAEKYVEALEQIPKTLAENAGLNPLDLMSELRARHAEGGEGRWFGIPASGKKIRDLHAEAVFEPLAVKKQVLHSATEAVCMLLRIDNVIQVAPQPMDRWYQKDIAAARKEGRAPGPAPSALATRV
jgi:archaeal chaperonin